MKYPMINAISCLMLLTAGTKLANGQDQHSREAYMAYHTGCWKSDDLSDGQLITRADKTFTWMKPATGVSGRNDTLRGTWDIRSVYSIPFKTDVIVLKFAKKRKEKYEIGTTSMPATIYLRNGRRFLKTDCK